VGHTGSLDCPSLNPPLFEYDSAFKKGHSLTEKNRYEVEGHFVDQAALHELFGHGRST
jgi:hypothetical protein